MKKVQAVLGLGLVGCLGFFLMKPSITEPSAPRVEQDFIKNEVAVDYKIKPKNESFQELRPETEERHSIKKQEGAKSTIQVTRSIVEEQDWIQKLNDDSLNFQKKREILFSLFGLSQDWKGLITVYHASDDERLKNEILRYLIRVGGEEAEVFLRNHWFNDMTIKQKLAIIQALGEGTTNESYQFLKELYDDEKLNTKMKMNLAHSMLSFPEGGDHVFKSFEGADDELIHSVLESMSEKNLTKNKEFLSQVLQSDLVDLEAKEGMIQAVDIDAEGAYDFLLTVIASKLEDELKVEALDKFHEMDEDKIDFVDDLSEQLGAEASIEVRKGIYEALHLQEDLNVPILMDQVSHEENDEVYLAGMQTLIHYLKLEGESLESISFQEEKRIHDLAATGEYEAAERLSKHFNNP